jgi:hypothetical protein
MDCFWIVIGLPLDCLWMDCVLSSDCVWIVLEPAYVLSLECLWDRLWIVVEMPLEPLESVFGLALDYELLLNCLWGCLQIVQTPKCPALGVQEVVARAAAD